MGKQLITVIHSDSKIETLFTLFPLLVSEYCHSLRFLHLNSKEVLKAEGECAILVRVFKGNKDMATDTERKRAYIKNLRTRFNRIVMLDDSDGSDSIHYEYIDLVDLYYKGKLLKDKSLYLKPMYGRQYFTNYYNEKYGIIDEKVKIREIPEDPTAPNKLRMSWNLGYGPYPVPGKIMIELVNGSARMSLIRSLKPLYTFYYQSMLKLLDRPTDPQNRLKFIHARFGSGSLPNTVAFQRKTLVDKCLNNSNFITGKTSPHKYRKEMKQTAAVLSPFGWGEICFRDFEAIINGSILIKPAMDCIETWPDIYHNSKTYIPIDWDGNNLLETVEQLLSNISAYKEVTENARYIYKESLLQINDRVKDFLQEATGMGV